MKVPRNVFFVLAIFMAVTACQVVYAAQETAVTLSFEKDQFLFDQLHGYDRVRLVDGSARSQLGEPVLPAQQVRVAIPSGVT